jgi:CubicO group peptidase (beta-lactamase class C family)
MIHCGKNIVAQSEKYKPMNKIYFLILLLILSSCRKDSIIDQNNENTNCDNIHFRKDNGTSFYENNPTYQNIENNDYHWESSSFSEANIDSLIFNSGANILSSHSTLFSFLLIRNDKIIFEKYYNRSKKDHSNNIHSASKCIISSLIGIAIDKGILEGVDQNILDFFPDYEPNDIAKEQITIEHLLNMTSGFDWEEDYTEYFIEDRGNWTTSILDLPLVASPGDVFNYSTGNTHLLSAILRNASELSTCEYTNSNLTTDLGIEIEHWGKDPQGYFSGGYNFYITPRELAQFGLLYLNNGISMSNQIVPLDWINHSLTAQVNVDNKYDYSYCWWVTQIAEENIYKAWGYGGQYICLIPDLDIMLISTANTKDVYDQFDIDSFIEQYVMPAVQL